MLRPAAPEGDGPPAHGRAHGGKRPGATAAKSKSWTGAAADRTRWSASTRCAWWARPVFESGPTAWNRIGSKPRSHLNATHGLAGFRFPSCGANLDWRKTRSVAGCGILMAIPRPEHVSLADVRPLVGTSNRPGPRGVLVSARACRRSVRGHCSVGRSQELCIDLRDPRRRLFAWLKHWCLSRESRETVSTSLRSSAERARGGE